MIIEDGTGRFDATSYVSVSEASTYLADRGMDADWIDLSNLEREQKLLRAMDYMAQMYRGSWRGYRSSTKQALDWPRQGVQLFDMPVNQQIDYNVIPREVKAAQVELALRAIAMPSLMADEERGVISETVGSVSVTYDRLSPQRARFVAIDAMLSYLMGGRGIMVPLVRT